MEELLLISLAARKAAGASTHPTSALASTTTGGHKAPASYAHAAQLPPADPAPPKPGLSTGGNPPLVPAPRTFRDFRQPLRCRLCWKAPFHELLDCDVFKTVPPSHKIGAARLAGVHTNCLRKHEVSTRCHIPPDQLRCKEPGCSRPHVLFMHGATELPFGEKPWLSRGYREELFRLLNLPLPIRTPIESPAEVAQVAFTGRHGVAPRLRYITIRRSPADPPRLVLALFDSACSSSYVTRSVADALEITADDCALPGSAHIIGVTNHCTPAKGAVSLQIADTAGAYHSVHRALLVDFHPLPPVRALWRTFAASRPEFRHLAHHLQDFVGEPI
jgi:hypothetical protein